jgi:proline dehydrogenase
MDLTKLPVMLLKLMPKQLIKPIAFKYVAGENIEDALKKTAELNKHGIKATMDILGESAKTEAEVERYVSQYKNLIKEIVKNQLKSGISIKPTALGMLISYDYLQKKLREIISEAKKNNVFVRIDMEDSPYTTQTIELYNTLRREYPRLGLVIQAYMHRTQKDLEAFNKTKADIRLCKGIYKEAPEVAIKGYHKINENYLTCLRKMFMGDFKIAIATHDYPLINGATAMIKELNIPNDRFEFQMLYGVRNKTAHALSADGYNMRIYVPYGKDWYAYSMRRMYENPMVAFYVARAVTFDVIGFVFRKLLGK